MFLLLRLTVPDLCVYIHLSCLVILTVTWLPTKGAPTYTLASTHTHTHTCTTHTHTHTHYTHTHTHTHARTHAHTHTHVHTHTPENYWSCLSRSISLLPLSHADAKKREMEEADTVSALASLSVAGDAHHR